MATLTRVTCDDQGRVILTSHLGPLVLTPAEALALSDQLLTGVEDSSPEGPDDD